MRAVVAQLVEHVIGNDEVDSSILSNGSHGGSDDEPRVVGNPVERLPLNINEPRTRQSSERTA